MSTVLLLIASNFFMTALPEYMLQVPANRWGNATFALWGDPVLAAHR